MAGSPYWGQMQIALDLIEEARKSGVDISIDMYPYTAGSSSVLQLLPPFAIEGGVNRLIERLNNPEICEQIRKSIESDSDAEWESKIQLIGWHNVAISSATAPELKQFEGKSITDSAAILSMSCFDFVAHVIRVDFGTTNIIMFQQSEADQTTVHLSRLQMVNTCNLLLFMTSIAKTRL
jgi:N-acyl-D-aspartate/D-glutamate deacylase